MERVNQELEQYLWLFTSERQDDWVDLLSMAEFQYPFLLNCGQHPQMGFEPKQPVRIEAVNEFADWMKLALEEAKTACKGPKGQANNLNYVIPQS